MGTAVTIPILVGIVAGHLDIGLAIGFGGFWCSPSNTSGSYRHKKMGILFSAGLITLVSFIGGYLHLLGWMLVPTLGLLTFCIAYISVYGFRASLISFSGLLALVLSFAHTPANLTPLEYALLIGLGGLWYLLLVILAHTLNPKAQTEELLTETFELTAAFVDVRGKLVDNHPDRSMLLKKLNELQVALTEHHGILRDILFSRRKNSGSSSYQSRRLLVFVQLVEILETAIANPVDYDKMDAVFAGKVELKEIFQSIIFEISAQLKMLATAPRKKDATVGESGIKGLFEEAHRLLERYAKSPGTGGHEDYVVLKNLLDYQQRQLDKLDRIKWLQSDPKLKASEFVSMEVLQRFLVPQDYDLKLGLRNFSLKSAIFKHSLRLAVTMMLGYLIGLSFSFQNPYWILLTVIVIMRPSYGLTKTRSKNRIVGTLLGALIAAGMVQFIHDPYVQGAIGVLSIVISFSLLQKNYTVAATFVTLSVVFIYAILRPDILVVIQYRILDTLIGALLSFIAISFLWPAWGVYEIRENIISSISANKVFFKWVTKAYMEKGDFSTDYKVARKTAFLETSNLNAAFQRMAQEPKSKQKNMDATYELVVLNHTLLSSLAALSTYLQNNKTTQASDRFKMAVEAINNNFQEVIANLERKKGDEIEKNGNLAIAQTDHPLANLEFADIEAMINTVPEPERNYQEAHLIWEQLRWQYAMSKKMIFLGTQLAV